MLAYPSHPLAVRVDTFRGRFHTATSWLVAAGSFPEGVPFVLQRVFVFLLLLRPSSSLHYASSSLLFIHPRVDEIDENSYELGLNQHNFDAKLDMMVKVYETCKTTKNNLETKSVVLIGPAHVNRLN